MAAPPIWSRLFPLLTLPAACLMLFVGDVMAQPVNLGELRSYSTPQLIGIELDMGGDDDHDAAAVVRYREQRASLWSEAFPLFRVDSPNNAMRNEGASIGAVVKGNHIRAVSYAGAHHCLQQHLPCRRRYRSGRTIDPQTATPLAGVVMAEPRQDGRAMRLSRATEQSG